MTSTRDRILAMLELERNRINQEREKLYEQKLVADAKYEGIMLAIGAVHRDLKNYPEQEPTGEGAK